MGMEGKWRKKGEGRRRCEGRLLTDCLVCDSIRLVPFLYNLYISFHYCHAQLRPVFYCIRSPAGTGNSHLPSNFKIRPGATDRSVDVVALSLGQPTFSAWMPSDSSASRSNENVVSRYLLQTTVSYLDYPVFSLPKQYQGPHPAR